MLVMRPAQAADLPQVQRLAADSPVGVTSLPDDAERLRDKILASEASFAAEVSYNGEESYFFVLEDSASGELVGCSAIVASAGFSEPFYSFRNETFVHASRSLSIHNKIHVLSLCHDLTGNSLLTSFYVQRDLVQSVYAELNSRGRLLFMASHPERFADAGIKLAWITGRGCGATQSRADASSSRLRRARPRVGPTEALARGDRATAPKVSDRRHPHAGRSRRRGRARVGAH